MTFDKNSHSVQMVFAKDYKCPSINHVFPKGSSVEIIDVEPTDLSFGSYYKAVLPHKIGEVYSVLVPRNYFSTNMLFLKSHACPSLDYIFDKGQKVHVIRFSENYCLVHLDYKIGDVAYVQVPKDLLK
ncbi:hypothetical protein [Hugenholtzia roseola]|uniref:hypothetical protein n=1 Tax=Hugenholtzia roseola TaxID=1002 RepID=UPI0013775B13|nr:hypothetical protein [Hugenholtzia roseola]